MSDELPDDTSAIVREIHRRMFSRGLNPTSLAAASELPTGYFADLFAGRSKNPSTKNLPKIAKALGCLVADLTDPRRSESDPSTGDSVDKLDEFALLGLWRILSFEGKRRVMIAALREAELIGSRAEGEGAAD